VSQTLQLSPGAAELGDSVALNLSFTPPAFSQIAALQWTLSYAPTDIVAITAIAGASTASAGKSLMCVPHVGSLTCIAVGMNNAAIPSGIVASINVTLAPTLTIGTTVSVGNALGASPNGNAIAVAGFGAGVNVISTPVILANLAIWRSSGPLGLWVYGSYDFTFVPSDRFSFFGLAGDQPVVGDWTGNGQARIGVFRPSEGKWYLDLNNNGQWDGVAGGDGVFAFGLPGDIAVVGDWSGDGRTKLGTFRCPQTGICTWALDYGGKFAYDPGTVRFYSYGLPGDIPVVNNWNGTSNVDQIGIYRPMPNGLALWIVDSNGTGTWEPSSAVYQFGLATDLPVVGNWNNGTRKRIGVFRNGMWILDTNGNNAYDVTDGVAFFGLPGDKPAVGNWVAQ